METVAGKSMVLSDDYVTMTKGLTSIEFGPGACEHHFKGHYSGEEVNADGYTIYCNTYTPTKRVYTLKVQIKIPGFYRPGIFICKSMI